MRFAIFTHVLHSEKAKVYSAYAPYVREMNLWLQNVQEVEIVAPITNIPKDALSKEIPYLHSNLTFTIVPSFDLLNFQSSIKAFFRIPIIFLKIIGAMRRADHLHLRCPGNIGLIACFAQIFFPYKSKTAKYAGNWDPEANQPWTYKLQKWILSNTFLTRNIQVLVYGDWPGQTKNIRPFFTASFSVREISHVRKKNFDGPFSFLFVGNLVPGKQPLKAIELVQEVKRHVDRSAEAPEVSLEIYGDGPEREMLETYCRKEKLERLVKFKGNRTLEELKGAYQKANFVILPSQSEGWPKAIAEAMFFGCLPIATPVSCVPWMLNYGNRGILIPKLEKGEERREKRVKLGVDRGKREDGKEKNEELKETVERIIELVNDPVEMRRMSREAQEWSQQYTLEKFEEAIKEVLRGNQLKTNKSSSSFGRGGGVG